MAVSIRSCKDWKAASNRHVIKLLVLLCLYLALSQAADAHPMPNSNLLLHIKPSGVAAEMQLPLSELQIAFGHQLVTHPDSLLRELNAEIKTYIRQHIKPVSNDGAVWEVRIDSLYIQGAAESAAGAYEELFVRLWMQPPNNETARKFLLYYDVIVHQLLSHVILVSISDDWEKGFYADNPTEVGLIRLDARNNTVPPLLINQGEGGLWSGFCVMVKLGLHHISEGTDHLLFLLTLLLPAPLIARHKKWAEFGGIKYSVTRIIKIVTAFTIGHCITLITGATGLVRLPSGPVEILIAVSILMSAFHAVRPLFPGREIYVAGIFGLIHGLAFAATLAKLDIDGGRMALSILGFNIGIEAMQLFVIVITMPWLIILSRTRLFSYMRMTGAAIAGSASLGWIVERSTGRANIISATVLKFSGYDYSLVIALAIIAVSALLFKNRIGWR